MARLTRVESQARTRAQLLDAASEVFARRGFGGASVDEVAEVAGYTKGAVYSNFGSKDELFLAVLQGRMQSQVELVEGLAEQARAGDGSVSLPDLDWTDLKWCLLTFEFWLYALRNPAVGERLAEEYRGFRGGLAPLLSSYLGTSIDGTELAAVTIALYEGLTLQRHLDPEAVPADLVIRMLEGFRDRATVDSPTRR
jgi:AcrR family transcriptional regulator